ncbi:MAG: hypothetical protein ABIQ30_02060 [Devosia sp.]
MKLTLGTGFLVLTLSMAGFAYAAPPTTPPGNSASGIDRYLDNPGRQQATEVGAQCDSGAGSGAFGFFGKDNNFAGGADGQATGQNNSALCGNRQGNLP